MNYFLLYTLLVVIVEKKRYFLAKCGNYTEALRTTRTIDITTRIIYNKKNWIEVTQRFNPFLYTIPVVQGFNPF
jgi:hypothetical protein